MTDCVMWIDERGEHGERASTKSTCAACKLSSTVPNETGNYSGIGKVASLAASFQRKLGPSIGHAEPELPVFFIGRRISHSPSFHGLLTQLFLIQFHAELPV